MASYFARHKIDKRAENFGNDDDPSTGYIAWLLWGGDAGQTWAEEHLKMIESRKKETRRPSRNALDGNVQRHFNSQH
jgi:hypothetical protein